jgi:hypothetical protein
MTKEDRVRLFVRVLNGLCAGMIVPFFADMLLCLITGHSEFQPGTIPVEMLSRYGHPVFYVAPQVAALHEMLVWVCFGSLAILLVIAGIGGVIRMIAALKAYRARIQ